MKKRYGNKTNNRVLAILILMGIATLFLSGCRSKKVTKDVSKVHTEVMSADTNVSEIKTDSTTHNYTTEEVKVYDADTGTLIREERRETGTMQVAVREKRAEDKKEATDIAQVSNEEENAEAVGKSAPVDPTEIQREEVKLEQMKSASARWIVVSVVALGIAVLIYITINRRRR